MWRCSCCHLALLTCMLSWGLLSYSMTESDLILFVITHTCGVDANFPTSVQLSKIYFTWTFTCKIYGFKTLINSQFCQLHDLLILDVSARYFSFGMVQELANAKEVSILAFILLESINVHWNVYIWIFNLNTDHDDVIHKKNWLHTFTYTFKLDVEYFLFYIRFWTSILSFYTFE